MTWSRSLRRELATVIAIGLISAASTSSALGAVSRPATQERFATATDVAGTIATDTTWTRAAAPYQVTGQVVVNAGVTLTIEPGVEVQVVNHSGFIVNGNLVAEGTRDAPIAISGTGPGTWPGLELVVGGEVGPRASLAFLTLSGGGGGLGHGSQIYGYGATLDLDHVTIRDGDGTGITSETGTLRMRGGSVSGNPGDAIAATGLHTGGGGRALDLEGVSITGNGNDVVVLQGPGGFDTDGRLRDVGVPYEIRGQITVDPGATLTLDPGVELRFADQGELVVNGDIDSRGTEAKPITLRGLADGPGTWYGLRVIGGQEAAVATFDHVTIRGAGQSGRPALTITNGRLQFLNGGVTQSGGDAIAIDGGTWPGTSRIEGSSITDIAGNGIRNDTTGVVIATKDWWGDPSGPSSDGSCSTGSGTPVSGLVRTAPWLTAADQQADPLAPAPFPVITMSPERWYAPADGQTRIWVNLTLRDPQGRPMPGRTIDLHASLGDVTTGGVTDAAGKTRAWLVASDTGNSELTAVLAGADACAPADAGEALVTFTDPEAGLIPGQQAPYAGDAFGVDPEPITVDVEARLHVRLTNPNAEPITVEVEFAYADYGIGLAFGPIGSVLTGEIPANGEKTFETAWVPPLSGHYCFEIRWRIVGAAGAADGPLQFAAISTDADWSDDLRLTAGGGSGRQPFNTTANPAANLPGPPGGVGGGGGPPNRDGANKVVGGLKSAGFGQASQINSSLGGDPPRLDYDQVAEVATLAVLYWPRESAWSDARWAAEQALADALFRYSAIGTAATVSLDRYGGASAAHDLRWAAIQLSSLIHFRGLLGPQAVVVADAVRDLAAIIDRESPDEGLTLAEATAELERIRTSGFNADELALVRAMGADDAAIEHQKEITLRQTPEGLAGRTADQLRKVEAYFREVGPILASTRVFPEQSGATADLSALTAADAPSALAAIGDTTTTFELGNPLDTAATIDLRSRPISLPAGWTVNLSTTRVTLEPGAKAKVAMTIVPSGPTVQGTIVKVAVEGFVGDELLGGVVAEVVIPEYVPFSASPSGRDDGSTLIVIGVAAVAVVVLFAGAMLLLRRRGRQAPTSGGGA
jgi:hypothetical protein